MKKVWQWDEWLARLEEAQARMAMKSGAEPASREADAPRTPEKRAALERHERRRRAAGLPVVRGYSVLKGP
jgi:hypothetical protein